MKSYYELLLLQRRATVPEVEAAFRHVIARYRPTLTVEQLITDPHFLERINAYFTLSGPMRMEYDRELQREYRNAKHSHAMEVPVTYLPPTPFSDFAPREKQLFHARIATWRREPLEAIHLLRVLLEHEPDFAQGWAALGEVYLIVDRLEEGAQALQLAVQCEPANHAFCVRLAHVRDALAGKVRLKVALSPEEELQRAERLQRWRMASSILLLGVAVIIYAFLSPGTRVLFALFVPWKAVAELALGMFLLGLGAGHGRLLQPFERVMLWSSLPIAHRAVRQCPYALLFFVTAVSSLWLSVATMLLIAWQDEEWPQSPSIVLGVCALLTLTLTYLVYTDTNGMYWVSTLMLGGNAPAIAAMLGWWAGSINMRGYD